MAGLLTDDQDIRTAFLKTESAGNGDYYILIDEYRNEEWICTQVRISMSGGNANTEVRLAVAALHRAMEAGGFNQPIFARPVYENEALNEGIYQELERLEEKIIRVLPMFDEMTDEDKADALTYCPFKIGDHIRNKYDSIIIEKIEVCKSFTDKPFRYFFQGKVPNGSGKEAQLWTGEYDNDVVLVQAARRPFCQELKGESYYGGDALSNSFVDNFPSQPIEFRNPKYKAPEREYTTTELAMSNGRVKQEMQRIGLVGIEVDMFMDEIYAALGKLEGQFINGCDVEVICNKRLPLMLRLNEVGKIKHDKDLLIQIFGIGLLAQAFAAITFSQSYKYPKGKG